MVNQILNTAAIRKQFPALQEKRTILDATASTQIPLPLMDFKNSAMLFYANVHRGSYEASSITTSAFEAAFSVAANFINARSVKETVMGENTTKMINAVKDSLRPEFRNGDNIVTTGLEHNANFVTWKAGLIPELKEYGRTVDLRIVDFDHRTGDLDMKQLADLVDERTKLVAVTGASNFMAVKPDIKKIAKIAHQSNYSQPNGMNGSYILVDGAQLVPSAYVDVQDLDIDFLAWSYHKMSAAQGLGGLFIRANIGETLRPFAFGGDHVAEVGRSNITFKDLPWKFMTGTPNVLETIGSGYGTSMLVNIGLNNMFLEDQVDKDTRAELLGQQMLTRILMYTPKPGDPEIKYFDISYNAADLEKAVWKAFIGSHPDIPSHLKDPEERANMVRNRVQTAMHNITAHEEEIMRPALERLVEMPNVTVYGPRDVTKRAALIAFNINGMNPHDVSRMLNAEKYGNIESRSGTHCASVAHEDLMLPGSVRISGYVYTDDDDLLKATDAIESVSRSTQ